MSVNVTVCSVCVSPQIYGINKNAQFLVTGNNSQLSYPGMLTSAVGPTRVGAHTLVLARCSGPK